MGESAERYEEYQYDVTKGLVDCKGFFGEYGGYHETDPQVRQVLDKFTRDYLSLKESEHFVQQLRSLQRHWLGRPTPLCFAHNLSAKLGGVQIYLKREDLAHTGAHKINHCLGEALLAKMMGRKRIITDTASGTHGICLSSAAARMGLECTIYVGENDWQPQLANIRTMQVFGTKVVSVSEGRKDLKAASDRAFQEFIKDSDEVFLAWSTIAGPQPFPTIVKDLQAVVGEEAREQMQAMAGQLPDHVVASVAGGSNALGIFQSFLTDDAVKLHAVEPEVTTDDNAVNLGNPGAGYLESFALLHDIQYEAVGAEEAAAAFLELARTEGILPAYEASYAIAHAMRLAKRCTPDTVVLVNLSGRAQVNEIDKAVTTAGVNL
eukprot:TRINITY_DN7276_c0_g1_i1.p1 TRINITY_DN7276_c0_g1~~TRINITY_DN7276_c0_g1_i1.p1  ORF type:complete len:378 (+),score=64.35 TRINITY_DN7276_c0_g1_i1:81-1214(+)